MRLRALTPFDRLGVKEGGVILAVRQMDGLNESIRRRQVKEDELKEIQRKREVERGQITAES